MTTRVAYVHMHLEGRFIVAGRLRYIQDGRFSQCLFEYSNRYLERPDAVAVDPVALPLQREHTYEGPLGGTLFNGILDACPDDWAATYSTLPPMALGPSSQTSTTCSMPGQTA